MMLGREFFTAGRAVFTVSNPRGEFFTYRVEAKDSKLFLSLLTGPNNLTDYTYLGVVDQASGRVKTTKRSKLGPETRPVRVADWALRHVWTCRPFPPGYALAHVGRCGRCGRPLTDPESIGRGLGPTCATV